MCGISGVILPAGTKDRDDDVRRMCAMLHHRGPDDSGWFSDRAAGVTLAHNRLTILDLSDRGHQPMCSEDGSVVLDYNGEIYNFTTLRSELEAAGEHFRSTGDTEVLLRAWQRWGVGCLDRLCGMFAVAVWVPGERTCYLARDPLGMKPLYYAELPEGGIAFASEAKALRSCSGLPRTADRESVEQFMTFGYNWRESHSAFEGIRKLPPGHLLTVRDGRANLSRWFRHERREVASVAELSIELADVLGTVVREHLQADVPVGLLLSGGLDSSLVAALASRQQKIQTFTMSFAGSGIDETKWARVVSNYIGSDHREVVITPEEFFREIEEAVDVVDDLFGDWGVVTTRLLYRHARQAGLKVVLVGEGSDELFGGYPQFAEALRMRGAGPLNLARLFRRYCGRRWAAGFPEFRRRMRQHLEDAHGDMYGAMRLFETVDQLPNNYVMKVDKASMSVSAEARAPFLDRRVASIAFRWRPTPEDPEKAILRQVARRGGLLPTEIVDRPKMGASVAASWMDDSHTFRAFARALVLGRDGWTDALGLRGAMEDFFDRGRAGYNFPRSISILRNVAWRLLMLNAWNRHFIGHPPS